MIVVDASVLLESLLRTPASEAVDARLLRSSRGLHAPHLIDVEVAQIVRRYAGMGEIGEERGRSALADLHDFPLRRYPHGVLLPRIWELRHNLTAYDAAYVALAEALEAPFLTRDKRLAGMAERHVEIELI